MPLNLFPLRMWKFRHFNTYIGFGVVVAISSGRGEGIYTLVWILRRTGGYHLRLGEIMAHSSILIVDDEERIDRDNITHNENSLLW